MRKTKKIIKKEKSMNKGLIVAGIVLLVLVVSLPVVRANVSLVDKIALVAGNILGERLSDEVLDSVNLGDELLSLGSRVGPGANEFCQNSRCTYVDSLSVSDATSSIAAIRNPFNSTSTVSLRIKGFLATSTVEIICGTSSTRYLFGSQTYPGNKAPLVSSSLIDRVQVATGTPVDLRSGRPNVDYSIGGQKLASLGGINAVPKVLIAPGEWASCYASSTAIGGGDGVGQTSVGLRDVGATASGTVEALFEN